MKLTITQTQNDYYQPSTALLAAINTSIFLKRPLLLAGEPGTGKTECADFVARSLNRMNPALFKNTSAIRFNTKSVSQSNDLFYYYDAVAHFGDKKEKLKESFIQFNGLGLAILATLGKESKFSKYKNYDVQIKDSEGSGSVVLIDEIDKAPRDFPNDLLAELEKPPFKFKVRESEDPDIVQNENIPIPIIITSNNEKGLPDAFLRRCVFHHIDFPGPGDLLKIVKSKFKTDEFGSSNNDFESAIAKFLEIRKETNLSKIPATSELLDWIACLRDKGLLNSQKINSKDAKETLSTVAKSKADADILSKKFGG